MTAARYPIIRQRNQRDCGIAALTMVARFHARDVSSEHLRNLTGIDRTGTSFTDLIRAAKHYGLTAEGVVIPDLETLAVLDGGLPAILWVDANHFVVYYGHVRGRYVIGDPAAGLRRLTGRQLTKRFMQHELTAGHPAGYAMLLTPDEDYIGLETNLADTKVKNRKWEVVLDGLRPALPFVPVILLGILALTGVQYLLPYFTKLIVDVGIGAGDLHLIIFLLVGQLVLVLSKTGFSILRSWLVLHLSLRVNFRLVDSFLGKLFALPIPFFETRRIGDILQRINDHRRIESFLTGNALGMVVSVLTVIVYSIVLASFHPLFFAIFVGATFLYGCWIVYFLRARREIDQERFRFAAADQSLLLQIVNGMHDLKINNSQALFREKWRENKLASFGNTARFLKVNQVQDTGTMLIIEIAQLTILFMSARLIITNQISLGAMLSIQFIIGQLVSPMEQIVTGIIRGQEAEISLDRITDFWNARDEAEYGKSERVRTVGAAVSLRNVCFRHPGQAAGWTLDDVSLNVPAGKVTAIVGSSGSGKTTLLKLLLGYYQRYQGRVGIGEQDLRDIDVNDWRSRCGVILQESFIFNETIRGNIVLGHVFDKERFTRACTIANLDEFALRFALGYDTPIGRDGKGLSMGQKQRVLMARAVYGDPEFVIMDEATNSLDAENERTIMDGLAHFFTNRTVLIVAHRLSTIQSADNIVVLHQGKVAEQGTHAELLARRGRYHQLIKQQM